MSPLSVLLGWRFKVPTGEWMIGKNNILPTRCQLKCEKLKKKDSCGLIMLLLLETKEYL